MNALPHDIQYAYKSDVWSPATVTVLSATVAVALAALSVGFFFPGMGGINIAAFTGGGALLLVDASILIYSCWRLFKFYKAVGQYEIRYPFERFEEYEQAFDFKPFVVEGRPYVVMYLKQNENHSAVFFSGINHFGKHMLQVMDSHQWVTPNSFDML